MSYFFPRIRDCRDDARLTQKVVGNILGIDQRTYSVYETGKRLIPINYLIELAILYETSLDYLVGLTDEKKAYSKNNTLIK